MFGGMAFGILVSITHNYVHVNNSASFSLSFRISIFPKTISTKARLFLNTCLEIFLIIFLLIMVFPVSISAPVISEDTARQALLEHVAQQCCWGKGAAEKMTIKELQSSTSYHVSLWIYIFISCAKFKTEKIRYNTVNLE